jgi:hypothetical protein
LILKTGKGKGGSYHRESRLFRVVCGSTFRTGNGKGGSYHREHGEEREHRESFGFFGWIVLGRRGWVEAVGDEFGVEWIVFSGFSRFSVFSVMVSGFASGLVGEEVVEG